MRRVVVTGIGIRSPIGNDYKAVEKNLRESNSGLKYNPDYAIVDMRCNVAGFCDFKPVDEVPHQHYRWMGPTAAMGYLSCLSAIEDAGLEPHEVSNPDTGLYFGSGTSSSEFQQYSQDVYVRKGVHREPTMVFKIMNSTTSANLTKALKIYGEGFTISSACSSSGHCIGEGFRTIANGYQDRMLVGGAETNHYSIAAMLDALMALSSKYNDNPTAASRPFDSARSGFVPGEGSGCLILEDYDTAVARGAKIYCEIVGYGATSDGFDMAHPSGEGAVRCMQKALKTQHDDWSEIDYINAHATGTLVGDAKELDAIRSAFGPDNIPPISSTKALTGHGIGAAGVQEAIYSIIMLNENFIAGTKNLEQTDSGYEDYPLVRKTVDAELTTVMSNSFGFGGANSSLVFKRVVDEE
jgi:3-oxoacyl-[acyl-carrier-protein] synthase-1